MSKLKMKKSYKQMQMRKGRLTKFKKKDLEISLIKMQL